MATNSSAIQLILLLLVLAYAFRDAFGMDEPERYYLILTIRWLETYLACMSLDAIL